MIINSQEELDIFNIHLKTSDCILVPILVDNYFHPGNNSISLLYFYFIDIKKEFVILYDHYDRLMDINIDLNLSRNIYTFDKKELLHIYNFDIDRIIDLKLSMYIDGDIQSLNNINSVLSSKYFKFYIYNIKNIRRLYTLSKLIEYCQNLTDIGIKFLSKKPIIVSSKQFKFYNYNVINNLQILESNGLYISKTKLCRYFVNKCNRHINNTSKIYSSYNLLTATGRPANSYNGINFAALNKTNGERGTFTSRFDKDGVLIEFDYESFHPRLISKLINYKIDGNIYNYLGKQLMDKDTLTADEYDEIKSITFQLIYGNIYNEFLVIPFFKKIYVYINDIWENFNIKRYYESSISGKKIFVNKSMNKYKLWNYIIQLYESEHNFLIMDKINKFMKGKKSKFILYTYDSFLFDFHKDDISLLHELEEIIMDDYYPLTIKAGSNYNELRKFKI